MYQIHHVLPSRSKADAGLVSAVEGLAFNQTGLGLTTHIHGASSFPRWRRRDHIIKELGLSSSINQVLHTHGLWLSPSRVARRVQRQKIPTVLAPHGMLDPWCLNRHRLFKKILLFANEYSTLQGAGCIQALCKSELSSIKNLGITAPVALIPNGIDLPDTNKQLKLEAPLWLKHGVPEGSPVLLYLGRFHTKKGISPLIKAWQKLQATNPQELWLVFAGFSDDGEFEKSLKHLSIPRVINIGPVFGVEKLSAYAHSSAFILPSFSEGLPVSALEAMSWNLPCLLSKACNMPDAFRVGAAMKAEPDEDELLSCLNYLIDLLHNSPSTLFSMGKAGRHLVETEFGWEQVSKKTADLYSWLLGLDERPDFVYL